MFSERLRARREQLGLSQRELNRRCDFAEHTIYQYEAARSLPSMENLKAIATQLDVTADYLIGMSDDPGGRLDGCELSDDERDMLDVFRREGWRGVIHLGADRVAK